METRMLKKPNILLLIADDVGNESIGCYGEGNGQERTPNIDALAARGTRFTRCYTNPVCAATRAALWTGKRAHRIGIGSNPKAGDFVPVGEKLLPQLLPPEYTSAYLGKYHLGERNPGLNWDDPLRHGWDYFRGWRHNPNGYFLDLYDDVTPWDTVAVPGPINPYSTAQLTAWARMALQRLPEPWFLTASYNAPHKPYTQPPVGTHTLPWPTYPNDTRGQYLCILEALDTYLGQLLTDVDYSDTVVIFFGDNGTPQDATLYPGKSKRTMFEPGVNVPLIVSRGTSGTVHSLLHEVSDIATLILQESGAWLPSGLDGCDWLSDPRDHVFVERFKPNPTTAPPTEHFQAVRGERWKVTRDVLQGPAGDAFYDLAGEPPIDPSPTLEGTLVPEDAAEVARLRGILDSIGGGFSA